MERRKHRDQAILAVARHLLAVVWSVLTHHTSRRRFSEERSAYKFYTWFCQLDETQPKGLTYLDKG